jgi:hypothetical protein
MRQKSDIFVVDFRDEAEGIAKDGCGPWLGGVLTTRSVVWTEYHVIRKVPQTCCGYYPS